MFPPEDGDDDSQSQHRRGDEGKLVAVSVNCSSLKEILFLSVNHLVFIYGTFLWNHFLPASLLCVFSKRSEVFTGADISHVIRTEND